MKTFTQEELTQIATEIHKVYAENNSVTMRLLDLKHNVEGGAIQHFTKKDIVELLESNLLLCRILHELTGRAEKAFLAVVPTLLGVSAVVNSAEPVV